MGFAGLEKDEDRANVIAYLRTLSDSPKPLPTPRCRRRRNARRPSPPKVPLRPSRLKVPRSGAAPAPAAARAGARQITEFVMLDNLRKSRVQPGFFVRKIAYAATKPSHGGFHRRQII